MVIAVGLLLALAMPALAQGDEEGQPQWRFYGMGTSTRAITDLKSLGVMELSREFSWEERTKYALDLTAASGYTRLYSAVSSTPGIEWGQFYAGTDIGYDGEGVGRLRGSGSARSIISGAGNATAGCLSCLAGSAGFSLDLKEGEVHSTIASGGATPGFSSDFWANGQGTVSTGVATRSVYGSGEEAFYGDYRESITLSGTFSINQSMGVNLISAWHEGCPWSCED